MIRDALAADAEAVAICQKECFAFPLSEDDIASFTVNPIFGVRVIEDNGKIAGHTVFTMIGPDCELLSVAVSEEYRRKGYGEALVRDVLDIAKNKGCTSVLLEVRVSNSKAQCLYDKVGFEPIAQRKDFYERPREDAITMLAVIDQE